MLKRCFTATAWLFIGSLSAYTALATDTDPVIVTATRTAQTADETLASVSVITRKDIERLQAHSVQDLLRGVPGISIANYGGPGKATSVFIRGTESDHVLVLVDGIKLGSATLGHAAFQDIAIEQIERIEIVRGPRSSLYGSEAIGGVIQIFTRKGKAKGQGKLKPFFSIGGDSDNTFNASAGLALSGQQGWFNITTSGLDSKGFNACRGVPNTAGCFTFEPDKDGYRNLSVSLRGGYRFNNDLEFDIHALRAESDNEFDGSFVNESETIQQVFGASLKYSASDSWHTTLSAGRSLDHSDNFKDGTFSSRFDTERYNISWQNDFILDPGQILTLGADYQDDRISSTTTYPVNSRDNTGLFAQYHSSFTKHDTELSLRHDDNEQFGSHITGGLAWGYRLDNGLRFTASYGTAYKAPTFNELYFPNFGNANLKPEQSDSIELGMQGKLKQGHWSVNIYQTNLDELIAYDASIRAAINVNKARIRGLEAIAGLQLGQWAITSNLSLLDPENRSTGANNGKVLPRRARQTLQLDSERDFGQYSIGATLLAVGKRYDDLANSRELDGYTTLDLRTTITLDKDWRFQARIENVFDKDYETAAFYNQSGITLYLTLRYQPE